MSCSITLHLIPFRQGLSLNLELGYQPANPCDPSVSPPPPSVELQMYIAMMGFSCRCWGFEFRSLCLHSKCAYLQNHHPRPNDFLKISFIREWSMCLCRVQRTICESWLSPTRRIPGIKLRQLVWNNCLYPLYQSKSKVLVNF